jgi:hypothetical protein
MGEGSRVGRCNLQAFIHRNPKADAKSTQPAWKQQPQPPTLCAQIPDSAYCLVDIIMVKMDN